MNNKVVVIILILIIAVVGVIWWTGRDTGEVTPTTTPNGSVAPTEEENTSEEETAAEMEVREFNVEGSEFAFDKEEIRVNVGEPVRINFTNTGEMNHDWVIDEFDARTQVLAPGGSETIEFTATYPGTFEYYCSVPGHREQGMVGSLVVE